MELSGHNDHIIMSRVKGIVNAVNQNFSELKLDMPTQENVWSGYRPVSTDGLPYLGRSKNIKNLAIAGGHGMLGISLGAGTGKIIADIVNENKTDIDITPYRIER
jgi:D-amino-acid dehydrogenase